VVTAGITGRHNLHGIARFGIGLRRWNRGDRDGVALDNAAGDGMQRQIPVAPVDEIAALGDQIVAHDRTGRIGPLHIPGGDEGIGNLGRIGERQIDSIIVPARHSEGVVQRTGDDLVPFGVDVPGGAQGGAVEIIRIGGDLRLQPWNSEEHDTG